MAKALAIQPRRGKNPQPRDIFFPRKFDGIFSPHRYKVFHGGRGGGKSWAVAKALLIEGARAKKRILCTREYQTSIADSVHKLLGEQISLLGLDNFYEVQRTRIIGRNGTEFIFKGLAHNIQEIKSTEGINICWAEEGQSVSEESWSVLIPTVREDKSEIWVTFNPIDELDPTYQRFVVNPPPGTLLRKINWYDNPWFPDVLKDEKDYLKRVDPDAYAHIWLGETRSISDAVIFRGKYIIDNFETPEDARFYDGVDWGFSQDPTVMIRCWIKERTLYIDREAYGIGVDIDKTPALFDKIPDSKKGPIYADSSRPETISYIRQRGYNIHSVKKWGGSVEDGISYIRSFEKVVIHERCKHTQDEFRLYKYKVDRKTEEVLPIIVDKHNHCIDAIRYAISKLILQSKKPVKVMDFSGREV